uniref:Uncharacterized protein n=1 Tax=Anguilla anguilla TaxID=7936 RepID=A0A0E9RMW2_ANGAN
MCFIQGIRFKKRACMKGWIHSF